MRRVAKYSLVTLAALLVLLPAAVWFVASTETGTAFLWRQAQPFLPEGIQVHTVDGRLTGPLVVGGVDFRSETTHLTLQRAELDWSPGHLLTALLHVDRLVIEGLHVTQTGTPPEPEPDEPFELPERVELPVAVHLETFHLRDFEFRSAPDTAPFVIDRATLAAGIDREELTIDRLTVRAPLFDVDGTAQLTAHGEYPIKGRFEWQARPPGYAPLDTETRLNGTLQSLLVSQEIAAPYNARSEVTLTNPLRDLNFNAELEIDEAALQAIGDDLPPVTLSANANARGSPADLELSTDLRASEPQYGTATAVVRGGLADQTVTLEQVLIELADRPARLRADGVIRLAGAQPDMDLNFEWQALRWPLEGEALVFSPEGRATATGTPQDLSFKVQTRAEEPYTGGFDLSLDGRFAHQVVEVERLLATLHEGAAELSASGRVALAGGPLDIDVTADWRQLRWPFSGEPVVTSPSGSITVRGTPDNIAARLDAGIGEQGRITGDVAHRDERIDVALDWRALAWPLAEPQVRSPEGSVEVAGPLENYELSVDAQVDLPDRAGAGGRIAVQGDGSLEAVKLNRINIEALEGTLTGTAEASWRPALSGAVDLRGEGLNPGPVLAEWPGKLGLRVKGQAEMKDGQWTAQLDRIDADGVLREHLVDLETRGDFDGEALDLERFSLASGDTRLSAQGRVGPSLDVDWRINSTDLSHLLPEAGGSLNGEGTARGPLQRPQVEAVLRGSGLSYQDHALESVDLDADVDVSGGNNSRLSLILKNGRAGGTEIGQVRLTGSGNARAHNLELSAQTSAGAADLAVDGTLENPWETNAAWVGQITQATLTYPDLAPWRLQEAAKARIDTERANLSHHCWSSRGARLCLAGEHGPAGFAAEFTLEKLDFDYFAALLPENLRTEGAVGGSGEIKQATGQPLTGSLDLRTTAGRIGTLETSAESSDDETEAARAAGGGPVMVAFRESHVRVDLGKEGIDAVADLKLQQQDGVQLEAQIPDGDAPFMEQPLDGRITADISELSFIANLVPEIESIDGRLEGDMRLDGSLQAPVLQGELALVDGTAALSGPGLELSDVRIDLIGKGEGGLRLDATASSGGGTLTVEGDADLAGPAPTANFSIQGRDFQVFNTSEAQVFASPDLEVKVGRERIDITGEVAIPRADITPRKVPRSAVTVSSDQVIVKSETQDEAQQVGQAVGHEIHSNVRVILGDRVHVEGFGLKAQFTGALRVIGEPGEPTKGSGEIRIVEGQYKAYGQDLTIEDGRILFPGGPITEPGLDVRAVRRPREDILVGVNVRGNLRKPEFTLFSEPSMTQQEQLSYLVLGRSLQQTSGAESSAINQAALALGLKSGDFLAKNVGERIGIDEVEVETSRTSTGTRQAALVLGKYLSPDLYLSYGIGLFEPVSTVRLQYAISSKWQVVTESSSTQSGGDIIYTIERGR